MEVPLYLCAGMQSHSSATDCNSVLSAIADNIVCHYIAFAVLTSVLMSAQCPVSRVFLGRIAPCTCCIARLL